MQARPKLGNCGSSIVSFKYDAICRERRSSPLSSMQTSLHGRSIHCCTESPGIDKAIHRLTETVIHCRVFNGWLANLINYIMCFTWIACTFMSLRSIKLFYNFYLLTYWLTYLLIVTYLQLHTYTYLLTYLLAYLLA